MIHCTTIDATPQQADEVTIPVTIPVVGTLDFGAVMQRSNITTRGRRYMQIKHECCESVFEPLPLDASHATSTHF